MKIVTVVGARPQFVKAAAVSRQLKIKGITEVIVHTGQHFDKNMSDVFFDEMQIQKPNYLLQIHSLGHGAMTGRMLEKIEEVLIAEKPDLLMVYGDTNSTLAGALAAKKLHIPVVHVEAGLRSFNMQMPEEVNRILTDRISDILFCPTDSAIHNLADEGFASYPCKIIKNGDVMQDAAMYYSEISPNKSSIVADLNLNGKSYVLCTFHRQENTDDIENLTAIVNAMNTINKTTEVIVPLHPRTKNQIQKNGLKMQFTCIDPVGYFDMIELLKHCSLVMTDSGGLQKEAFFFGKHCVTMRDQTEWVELVEGGFNILTGAYYDEIIEGAEKMMQKQSNFSVNLYGGGTASEQIAIELSNYLKN